MKRLTPNQKDYSNLLLAQQTTLTALVQDQYFSGSVQLQQIAEYIFEDRGIYRVGFSDGCSYVLRAFRYNVKEILQRQATLYTYLEQQAYPAPRILHTINGSAIALYQNWMTLMVSYVEGSLADFSLEHLTLLGAQLGMLHARSEHILDHTASSAFPTSRLHPQELQKRELTSHEVAQLPGVLRTLYEASVATLDTLQQATQLPITLLHGDCWPHNAVVAEDGQLTLIDWDCAGLGPAILDVGYLLLTCHLGQPQLPKMYADPTRIEAVIQGYNQQRRLMANELVVLREAVHFETARRVLANGMFAEIADNWQEDVRIQKELARFTVSNEISEIARKLV